MLLVLKGFYTVYAVAKSREHCELLEFLEGLGQTLQIKGKLFEFIQGRVRVLWFYDEGRLIICTSGFVKKGQKTPRGEIDHAIQLMDDYFEDKKKAQIQIYGEEGV